MKSAITTTIGLTFFVVQLVLAQATLPTTRPSMAQINFLAARDEAAKADGDVAAVKTVCLAKLHSQPEYTAAISDRDAKEKTLDRLRKTGPMSDRMLASAEFVKANEVVKKTEADFLKSDADLNIAVAAAALAHKSFVAARDALAKEEEAIAEKRKRHISDLAAGKIHKGDLVSDVNLAWGKPDRERQLDDGTTEYFWKKYIEVTVPDSPGDFSGVQADRLTATQGGSSEKTTTKLSRTLTVGAKNGIVIEFEQQRFK